MECEIKVCYYPLTHIIMNSLIQARIKAFSVQLGSFILVAVVGVFLSPDFKTIITEHFGNTAATSLAILLITGIASHIANKLALKKLGASDNEVILI